MAFAAPKYGNSDTTYYKNWRLKTPDASKGEVETHFVGRIVPPIKSLAESGKWAIYHGQHFGYSGTDPKNPDKARQRPFACIQNKDFRTKMITVRCAACEVIADREAELERRKAEYTAQGLSESDTKDRLAPLNEWLKRHNCDRKWHINMINEAGEYGVLQISHTLKKVLDKELEEYRNKRKSDPIIDGVLWDFTRMGKFPVTDNVKPATETVTKDGEEFQRVKKVPFTDAEEVKINDIHPDLQTGTVRTLNGNQIDLVVASGGDPEEIDRIWSMTQKAGERSPRPAATVNAAVAQAPRVERPAQTVVAEDDEEAKLVAALAASRAKKAAALAAAKSEEIVQTTVVDQADDINALSDDDFYAKFGVKS